ncbi:MAG: hypothetical protein IPN76_28220 [Saprospiraceae bacterium]|nr:hypothetical protein [Saprospiraceae bacterium]
MQRPSTQVIASAITWFSAKFLFLVAIMLISDKNTPVLPLQLFAFEIDIRVVQFCSNIREAGLSNLPVQEQAGLINPSSRKGTATSVLDNICNY